MSSVFLALLIKASSKKKKKKNSFRPFLKSIPLYNELKRNCKTKKTTSTKTLPLKNPSHRIA